MYLGYDVWLLNQRIRVFEFNAYELKDLGGKEAKATAERLLSEGVRLSLIEFKKRNRDNFGRLLGDIYISYKDGTFMSFKQEMLRLKQGVETDEDGK